MFNLVEKELKKRENYSVTENGAIGYKSTKSALVDINYQVSSLRNSDEDEIIALFDKAFDENPKYTLKWLFFARDVREGLGERRLFRICYKRLSELNIDLFCQNLTNISEYGRWDDLISLLGINNTIDDIVGKIIKSQLQDDLALLEEGKPISLLGKWLPSENASSTKTKILAKKVRYLLDMSPRKYRLMLSKLRNHLKVVEVKMCSKQWNEIDYEKVPSMANLKYKEAFMRHDPERRSEYLNAVENGSKKINMKVATPVDIVSRYNINYFDIGDYDITLELAWKNLTDIPVEDTLVVADGSGSMFTPVGSGSTQAIDVATALAIYTSEHNNGVYKDKYITFSNSPKFVDMSEDKSLREKILTSREHHEISNTNIEAVFDLILSIAIKHKIPDVSMIKNVLIISDMEFDYAQGVRGEGLTSPLFDEIKERYNAAGYNLPKLIFWNVNSRTKTIPLTENELGVVLVSGFSQNILKMMMSSKLDPYQILIETLDSKRYDNIVVGV